jgi:hypothetical protein
MNANGPESTRSSLASGTPSHSYALACQARSIRVDPPYNGPLMWYGSGETPFGIPDGHLDTFEKTLAYAVSQFPDD